MLFLKFFLKYDTIKSVKKNKKELINIMKYDNNYHSVYKISYHIVFCVKYRRKVITNEISMRLKEIFLKISPKYKIALME